MTKPDPDTKQLVADLVKAVYLLKALNTCIRMKRRPTDKFFEQIAAIGQTMQRAKEFLKS